MLNNRSQLKILHHKLVNQDRMIQIQRQSKNSLNTSDEFEL